VTIHAGNIRRRIEAIPNHANGLQGIRWLLPQISAPFTLEVPTSM
jgi:hypothetical protein